MQPYLSVFLCFLTSSWKHPLGCNTQKRVEHLEFLKDTYLLQWRYRVLHVTGFTQLPSMFWHPRFIDEGTKMPFIRYHLIRFCHLFMNSLISPYGGLTAFGTVWASHTAAATWMYSKFWEVKIWGHVHLRVSTKGHSWQREDQKSGILAPPESLYFLILRTATAATVPEHKAATHHL